MHYQVTFDVLLLLTDFDEAESKSQLGLPPLFANETTRV